MQTGDRSADADNFNDVFDATSRDSGADTAAPEAGQARDEQGRFSTKQEQPAPEVKPPQPEAEKETDTNRHVPLKELLGERDRYKSEKKLREEAEARASERDAELKALRSLLDRQSQQQPQRQPEPQQAQEIPDPVLDPQGWAAYQANQVWVQNRHAIADISESIAREKHGDELVNKALAAGQQAGVAREFWAKSKNPYGDLVAWFKRAEVAQRIGPDPDAYEKNLEAKIRAKVLEELKTGSTKPKPVFPGSLADGTATGESGTHLTEEAVAAELFNPNRNRRAS